MQNILLQSRLNVSKLVPGNLVRVNCKWAIWYRHGKGLYYFEENPYAIFIKIVPGARSLAGGIRETHAIVLHGDNLVPVYACYLKPIKDKL